MEEQKCPKCKTKLENIKTYSINVDDDSNRAVNRIVMISKVVECPKCIKNIDGILCVMVLKII